MEKRSRAEYRRNSRNVSKVPYEYGSAVRIPRNFKGNPLDDHSVLFSDQKMPEPDRGNDTGSGLLCGFGGGCLQRLVSGL